MGPTRRTFLMIAAAATAALALEPAPQAAPAASRTK
jgi:hypothetical protein